MHEKIKEIPLTAKAKKTSKGFHCLDNVLRCGVPCLHSHQYISQARTSADSISITSSSDKCMK